MITKEALQKCRGYQFNNKYLGSTPQAMFVNNKFNSENWNGGDDLIRDYFSDIETSSDWQKGYELNDDIADDLIYNFYYFEDQAYGIIIVRNVMDDDIHNGEQYFDTYSFSWYKHRGATESAICNGHLMTEDEYLKLLNLIESTGYKFKV